MEMVTVEKDVQDRINELQAMSREEYNAYLDNLLEENVKLNLELREIRVSRIKRDIELELKKRNLSAFKDVFTNFEPTNASVDIYEQVDLIENAVLEYMKDYI